MATLKQTAGWGSVALIAATNVAGAQITAIAPAQFSYSIDGGAATNVDVPGVQFVNGMYKYSASVSTAEGVDLSITYTVDAASNPTASAIGQFKCTNNSAVSRGVEAAISFPLCPVYAGGTLFGGSVTLLVVANADGGGIFCLPGAESVWQAMIGDEAAHNLYWCPFQMQTTGSGTMQSTSVFGAPIPGKPGPDSAPTLGSRNRLTITAGESLTVTSNFVVKSLGEASGCVADLNGDGAIDGEDLSLMLGQWGDNNACAANDLNNDGLVDGLDLAAMLGSWGPCED